MRGSSRAEVTDEHTGDRLDVEGARRRHLLEVGPVLRAVEERLEHGEVAARRGKGSRGRRTARCAPARRPSCGTAWCRGTRRPVSRPTTVGSGRRRAAGRGRPGRGHTPPRAARPAPPSASVAGTNTLTSMSIVPRARCGAPRQRERAAERVRQTRRRRAQVHGDDLVGERGPRPHPRPSAEPRSRGCAQSRETTAWSWRAGNISASANTSISSCPRATRSSRPLPTAAAQTRRPRRTRRPAAPGRACRRWASCAPTRRPTASSATSAPARPVHATSARRVAGPSRITSRGIHRSDAIRSVSNSIPDRSGCQKSSAQVGMMRRWERSASRCSGCG